MRQFCREKMSISCELLVCVPNIGRLSSYLEYLAGWHDGKQMALGMHYQLYLYGCLRVSLISFPNFARWQRLIARNVCELFSSNRGISHLHKACCMDELSRGFVLGLKFSQQLWDSNRNVPQLLANSCVLLVFCVFHSNSLTMAAAGAIRRMHSTNGGIQWLQVKPWMSSIRRCAPRRTAASPWQSKLPAIRLQLLLPSIRCRPLP